MDVGKINRNRALPMRLRIVHRASGVTAIVVRLPIAYNCLASYGFEHYDRRALIHATEPSYPMRNLNDANPARDPGLK